MKAHRTEDFEEGGAVKCHVHLDIPASLGPGNFAKGLYKTRVQVQRLYIYTQLMDSSDLDRYREDRHRWSMTKQRQWQVSKSTS